MRIILAWLLLCSFAFAQRESLEVTPYTLQVLEVEVPASGAVEWDIVEPVEIDVRVFDDGKISSAVFVSAPAGRQILAKATVASLLEGRIKFDSKRWIVKSIGKAPKPDDPIVEPDPVVPPVDVPNALGLGKLSYAEAVKASDVAHAQESAGYWRRTGKLFRTQANLAKVLWSDALAFTANSSKWAQWRIVVEAAAKANAANIRTNQQWESACNEIAASLEAVK